jgi:hypothetical protein
MFKKTLARGIAVAFGVLAFTGGLVFANPNSVASMSPDEALQKLMDGTNISQTTNSQMR